MRSLWESLWRFVRYRLVIPLFRTPHSPEYSARGIANGVFWSLTPTFGVQTITATVTWFVLRFVFSRESSLLLALLWTSINNALTVLPLYYVFYVTGQWLMGTGGVHGGYRQFVDIWHASLAGQDWLPGLTTVAKGLGLSLIVGCVPYAALGTALSYRWSIALVRQRQRRLRKRRQVRMNPTPDESRL